VSLRHIDYAVKLAKRANNPNAFITYLWSHEMPLKEVEYLWELILLGTA
jgi:hypothetical protein